MTFPSLALRRRRRLAAFAGALAWWLLAVAGAAWAQTGALREWTDSTGRFKITAQLIEVQDETVFLKGADGKTMRIPVNRLSQADQQFLKSESSPFEEVGGASAAPMAAGGSDAGGQASWNEPLKINWDIVNELNRSVDGDWKLDLAESGGWNIAAKRAILPKKLTFHEDIRRLEINPLVQRAVVGYTVSFGVPKPQSRLSLIDLASGRAINASPVEGDMVPLCLLSDGATVLMNGASDERKGFETPDQIQLWRINGTKAVRTPSWIPFPDEGKSFGRTVNGNVVEAISLPGNRLILRSSNGRLACIDAATRRPYWQTKLSNNCAIDASLDGKHLAVVDGHTVMIVDPLSGEARCAQMMDDKPQLGWTRTRWSPGGDRLLVSFMNQLRVLDLKSGEWLHQCSFPAGLIAPNALAYPHDDYALLDNRLLVHLPSQIKVCDYRNATRIAVAGGLTLVAQQGGDGGSVSPSKLPHPGAEKILAQAEKDPSVFLIHPGVRVSIDASGAGQWSAQVAKSLEAAAQAAGYVVAPNAPVTIVGAISGPKQEAVSYIASGSYIASVYQSSIRLTWQGKDVWKTGGNNIPGVLQTERGKSIQDKLNELGKSPNLSVFERAAFPKLLQRPTGDGPQPQQSEALLAATFSPQGWVDAK